MAEAVTAVRTCRTCALAVWDRTKAGALHPKGRGVCGWSAKVMLPIWAAKDADWIRREQGRRTVWRDDGPHEKDCPTHEVKP